MLIEGAEERLGDVDGPELGAIDGKEEMEGVGEAKRLGICDGSPLGAAVVDGADETVGGSLGNAVVVGLLDMLGTVEGPELGF